MRVLLATGEHRQQKGSKAYTLDICKTSLSQKYIFNYRAIRSLSGLARSLRRWFRSRCQRHETK